MSRLITIPTELVPHVSGALGLLADPFRWEEYGTATIEDCTVAVYDMLDGLTQMDRVPRIVKKQFAHHNLAIPSAETDLASFYTGTGNDFLPAGVFGNDDALRIEAFFKVVRDSSGTPTVTIKTYLNSVLVASLAAMSTGVSNTYFIHQITTVQRRLGTGATQCGSRFNYTSDSTATLPHKPIAGSAFTGVSIFDLGVEPDWSDPIEIYQSVQGSAADAGSTIYRMGGSVEWMDFYAG